jgi:hypothetical protein
VQNQPSTFEVNACKAKTAGSQSNMPMEPELGTNTESEKEPFPISRMCWPQTANPILSGRTSAVEERGGSKSNAKTSETKTFQATPPFTKKIAPSKLPGTEEPIVSSPPVLPSMNANPEDKTGQKSKTNDKESSKTMQGASKVVVFTYIRRNNPPSLCF